MIPGHPAAPCSGLVNAQLTRAPALSCANIQWDVSGSTAPKRWGSVASQGLSKIALTNAQPARPATTHDLSGTA